MSDTAVSSINDPYRSSMIPGPGILQKGPGGVAGGNTTPGGGMGKKSNSTSQLSAAGKGHATQLAPPLQDLKPTDDMRDLPPSVPLQMLSGSDNQGTFIVFHWVTGALFGGNNGKLLPLLTVTMTAAVSSVMVHCRFLEEILLTMKILGTFSQVQMFFFNFNFNFQKKKNCCLKSFKTKTL